MWPAWGYGLWAPLPGVCVRRALPLLGPVAFEKSGISGPMYFAPGLTFGERSY